MKLKKSILKKVLATTVLGMTLMGSAITVQAGSIPRVYLNGTKLYMEHFPFIEAGITYIPLRSTEQFGFKVHWDQATSTVTLTDNKNTLVQKVGSNIVKLNGKTEIDLGAPAITRKGVTYVPIRFISNALGGVITIDKEENIFNVDYDITINEGYGLDHLGRLIKLNEAPNGESDIFANYTPVGVTKDTFETVISAIDRHNEGANPKDYKLPKDIASVTGVMEVKPFGCDEYKNHHVEIINELTYLILNVDYRTIDDSWALRIAKVFNPSLEGFQYELSLSQAREYVEHVKKEKLIVTGDYYVEPLTMYRDFGDFINMHVSYKSNKDAFLFDEHDVVTKGGVQYTGVVRVRIAPAYYGPDIEGETRTVPVSVFYDALLPKR